MLDLKKEWSISFAGCGFMGMYYVGAASCILERFPRFIQDASKIYGASAGALMATILTVGMPLEKCCADLMAMAKDARKHKLGPLHPAFSLLGSVRESLLTQLPEDAHVRASGKLCVSLTRVSDGKNVLVSEFNSREELMDALVCSCFVPFYCGVIPPTYRGVHYVDGAVSDNLPRCHQRNTITFSAYAGESDICPRGSVLNFHEVRFNNVSIQVNSENLYRVTSTFFPPQPEAIAEICQNGYLDALRFLQENNLISRESPFRSLETDSSRLVCCELVKKPAEDQESGENAEEQRLEDDHLWLDPKVIENLPFNIQKVLCEACRETHTAGGLLSQVTEYLPKKVTSLAQKLVDWIPDVPRDVNWLYGMAGGIYKQALKHKTEDSESESPLRRSTSLPSALNLWSQGSENPDGLTACPEASPTSSHDFTFAKHNVTHHMPLTPPHTPTAGSTSKFDEAPVTSPPSAGRGSSVLGRAVGWLRNIGPPQS
ncbi:patatin-like phospholipase domain-containing protein 2 [Mugil cephalus]|uniref:patatin-like phospholipase domain-containing protein 2 n=1 Tax=Mugil cephalus TaxID=48193 RepID=UPI001FB5836F|nr:patatin-like phospholipase domain-containing protein 2 [Mugil cephalus]